MIKVLTTQYPEKPATDATTIPSTILRLSILVTSDYILSVGQENGGFL